MQFSVCVITFPLGYLIFLVPKYFVNSPRTDSCMVWFVILLYKVVSARLREICVSSHMILLTARLLGTPRSLSNEHIEKSDLPQSMCLRCFRGRGPVDAGN